MYEPRPFQVMQNRKEAEGIFTLVLEPADNAPLFDFEAGQFAMLQLLNEDGSVWAQAAYSIANAPCESEGRIEFGIKVGGDFTKRVEKLEVGDEVMVRGSYGVFTPVVHDGPHVFFAGGIGIAPIRSMVRHLLLCESEREVFLFYSSRTHAEMAYEAEFRDLASQHPNFYPVFCITRETPDGWGGECERVNIDMVKRYFSEFAKGIFYACGPKPFMEEIRSMLESEGVNIENRLRKEEF